MGVIPPLDTFQVLVIVVDRAPGRVNPMPIPVQLVDPVFKLQVPEAPVAVTDPVKAVPMAAALILPVTMLMSSLERLFTVTV